MMPARPVRYGDTEHCHVDHGGFHDRGYDEGWNDCRDETPALWPWATAWWKPRDRRRNLVRAAALVLADIERIDRAAIAKGEPGYKVRSQAMAYGYGEMGATVQPQAQGATNE
jgi:hypothetical protein